jgi:hypothetical protein
VHAVEPAGAADPDAQARHSEASLAEYVPATQRTHVVDEAAAE